MTPVNQAKEVYVLTEVELQGISGGRTNGDNAFVQVVVLAEKASFYKAQLYAANNWPE